jgi:hypothetical protein
MKQLTPLIRDYAVDSDCSSDDITSNLDQELWALLESILRDTKSGRHFCSQLRHIHLLDYDDESVRRRDTERGTRAEAMDLLNSRINIKFTSTILKPGDLFYLEAEDNKECGDVPTNGTPAHILRRILIHVGFNSSLEYYKMCGQAEGSQSNPATYTDPIRRLRLNSPINVTHGLIRDRSCTSSNYYRQQCQLLKH